MIHPPGWRFSFTVRITQAAKKFPFAIKFRIISGFVEYGMMPVKRN
jgi:hypothetical protein